MATKTRERYIPSGSTEVRPRPADIEAVVYVRATEKGSISAIAYQGKRTNHDWNYLFKDRDACARKVKHWFEEVRAAEARKAGRRQAREDAKAAGHPFKVGDIFHHSWGYDQTQCDYYQAVEVTKGTVTLREIASTPVEDSDGFMSDRRTAVKDAFLEGDRHQPMRKTVQYFTEANGGRAYLSMEHGWMSEWDGEPKYCSWYA